MLRAAGYLVELRRAPSGDPLGYKLARPGDVTAAGAPVFYSGSKLAPDLSLPRLQQRWATLDAGPPDGPVEVGRRVGCRRCRAGAGARRGGRGPARHSVGRSSRRGRGRGGGVHRPARCRATARPGAGRRSWTPRTGTTGRPARRAVRPSRWARPGSGCAGWRAGWSRCAGLGGGTPGGLVALVVALAALTEEISAWHQRSWSAASGAPGIGRRARSAAVAARIPRCRCRGRGRANTASSTEGSRADPRAVAGVAPGRARPGRRLIGPGDLMPTLIRPGGSW